MEFDSDRKRMSIIIRDGPDIKLFMKGADAQVLKRLNEKEGNKTHKEITKDYVNYFSEIGYRTLIVGVKIIDENEYLEFENKIKEAGKDLVNKAKNIEKIYDEIEQNIYILGSTIVEDKLQDEVPETIRDLRLAKIKVWMLTGDKFNTAKNIGLSCNLISNDMKIFQIKSDENQTLSSFQESYIKEKDRMKENNTKFGVIVDGDALTMILNSEDSTNAFLQIAKDAESVICCRVSPNQKAEVVLAVKNYDTTSVTLSIGDGGNDVPMITQAHIGNLLI
jgi:phospholipid-transporting ATPase